MRPFPSRTPVLGMPEHLRGVAQIFAAVFWAKTAEMYKVGLDQRDKKERLSTSSYFPHGVSRQ